MAATNWKLTNIALLIIRVYLTILHVFVFSTIWLSSETFLGRNTGVVSKHLRMDPTHQRGRSVLGKLHNKHKPSCFQGLYIWCPLWKIPCLCASCKNCCRNIRFFWFHSTSKKILYYYERAPLVPFQSWYIF